MGNSFLTECSRGISQVEDFSISRTIQHSEKFELKKNINTKQKSERGFLTEVLSFPQRSFQIDKIYQQMRHQRPILYSIESNQILAFHGVKTLKQLFLRQTNSCTFMIQSEKSESLRMKQVNLSQLSEIKNESSPVEPTPDSSQTNEYELQNQIKIKRLFLRTQNEKENSFISQMEKNIIRNRSSSQSFSDFNLKDGLNFGESSNEIIESESFSLFSKQYIYVGYINASGKPHGPGQLYRIEENSQNQEIFIFIEAEFVNGSISTDDLIIIFKDQSFYRGSFYQSAFHGKGHLKLKKSLQLIGNFVYGLLQGRGKAIYSDGGTYEGFFQAGIRQGKGSMVWKSQKSTKNEPVLEISYQGFFKNDKMNGLGYLRTPNYEYWGPFSNNMKEGKGTIKFKNGNKFQGWFEKDEINGYGQLHYANGEVQRGIFPISRDQK